jgi:hypothetical protein
MLRRKKKSRKKLYQPRDVGAVAKSRRKSLKSPNLRKTRMLKKKLRKSKFWIGVMIPEM